MSKTSNQFSIALEHTRIALLQRRNDQYWDVVDSVDIEGQDESKIGSIFTPYAKKWIKKSKKIATCLPADVIEFETFNSPLNEQERMLKQTHGSDETYYIESTVHPDFTYTIFEKEHVELTRKFLSKFGFEITAIGFSDTGFSSCSPIFYDIKMFAFDKASASGAQQLELDWEAKTKPAPPAHSVFTTDTKKAAKKRNWLIGVGIIAAIGLASVSYWSFLPPQNDPPQNNQSEAPLEAETPTIEPESNTPETTVQPIDAPSQSEPQNVEPTVSAEDQLVFPEQSDDDPFLLLTQKPEFDTPWRPDGHDAYVENFPNSIQIATVEPDSIPLPPSRPDEILELAKKPAVSLIGISGAAGRPGALIQTANGDFRRVKIGDTVDGWKIEAISKKEVIIAQAGNKETLSVPSE